MSFPWREVLKVAGTGAATMYTGPFAPLVVASLGAALKTNSPDDLERWGKDIEELAKNGRIDTNKARAMVMRGKIRYDIYQRTGNIPSKEEVKWLLDTLVMTYYGVESVEDL